METIFKEIFWLFFYLWDGFLIFGFWLFSFSSYVWIPLVFILAVIASYLASKNIFDEYKQRYEEETKQREQAQEEVKIWKASLIEKSAGFPTFLQAIEQYDKIKDEKIEQFLRYKSHPSKKGQKLSKKKLNEDGRRNTRIKKRSQ
ncbi:MAG: hypothetical protein PHW31_00365 [Candidatus Pacebacteria bacterium]|nr:hypothetical protein [Candidatus Paceibacterota bacterium]